VCFVLWLHCLEVYNTHATVDFLDGFGWAEDANDPSAVYRGNNLFFVSLYDHMYQRGYVKNVPGAPMCACAEQMPTVSRSDCTQINFESEFTAKSFIQ
jgi:hypothetical protein